MTAHLDALTHKLIDAAKSAGADAADALAISETSLSISVRGGALDQADRSEGAQIGLRVMVDQKQACISSSDIRDDVLADLADRAVAMARVAPDDPHIRQATPDEFAKTFDVEALDLWDPTPEPEAAALQSRGLEAEAAALAIDGVAQIQSAGASFSASHFHLATSAGFSGGYRRTGHATSCVAVAGSGTGMERDSDYDFRIHGSDLRDPHDIGTCAGERVVAGLNPRKPPTGEYPVLYDERVSSSLIAHLLGAASGSAVARGATWLRNRLGQQVLPKGMSLIEEPHRARVSGSLPFDAEGLATSDRLIVDDGMLTGWTLDLTTAARLGMKTTASARRGTTAPPSPGVGNVRLTQGSQSREDLIRDMGTGLLLTSMIGATINENTGDYSRGASGFWVENGEIQYPVAECTIAGNLADMLARIIPANDGRAHLSRPIPSILVGGMILAGA